MTDPCIDVVVAVRNEEKNIPPFVAAIEACRKQGVADLRITFVEDNSTDATREVLAMECAGRPWVRFYSIQNQAGQAAAIAFGLARSGSPAVIMMDVDGSHPPPLIPMMVRKYREGAQIVQTVRVDRNRKVWRGCLSQAFNVVTYLVSGTTLRNQNVYFRLVSNEVRQSMMSDKRTLRFLRLNLSLYASRYKIDFLEFEFMPREHGASKYDFFRLLDLGIEGLLSLTSVGRMLLVLALAAVVGTALILHGAGAVGALLIATSIYVAYRYALISMQDTVENVRVLGSGQSR